MSNIPFTGNDLNLGGTYMTSKVNTKFQLGAVLCALLISIFFATGCKQEASSAGGVSIPGYGATVGIFTDTTWEYTSPSSLDSSSTSSSSTSKSISFGSEGNVSLGGNWSVMDESVTNHLTDFTYSVSSGTGNSYIATISGRAKNNFSYEGFDVLKDAIVPVATVTLSLGNYTARVQESLSSSYRTYALANRPQKDNFVGTYYNSRGVKSLQINSNDTIYNFENGGKIAEKYTYVENSNKLRIGGGKEEITVNLINLPENLRNTNWVESDYSGETTSGSYFGTLQLGVNTLKVQESFYSTPTTYGVYIYGTTTISLLEGSTAAEWYEKISGPTVTLSTTADGKDLLTVRGYNSSGINETTYFVKNTTTNTITAASTTGTRTIPPTAEVYLYPHVLAVKYTPDSSSSFQEYWK